MGENEPMTLHESTESHEEARRMAREMYENADKYVDDERIVYFHMEYYGKIGTLGSGRHLNRQMKELWDRIQVETFGDIENDEVLQFYDTYLDLVEVGHSPKAAYEQSIDEHVSHADKMEEFFDEWAEEEEEIGEDGEETTEQEDEDIEEGEERRKEITEISNELLELKDCTIDGGDKIRATVTDIWQREDEDYVVEAEWGLDADPYTHRETFPRERGWNPETCRFDRLMEYTGVEPGNLEEAVDMGMDIEIDISGDTEKFFIPPTEKELEDEIEEDEESTWEQVVAKATVPVTVVSYAIGTVYGIGASASYDYRMHSYEQEKLHGHHIRGPEKPTEDSMVDAGAGVVAVFVVSTILMALITNLGPALLRLIPLGLALAGL